MKGVPGYPPSMGPNMVNSPPVHHRELYIL
jgi:hypothetical protein